MSWGTYNGITATIFNGTSFVARNLIARLGGNGTQMVLGYRGSRYDDEKMRTSAGLGQMYYAHYFLKDEESLRKAMQYSSVVVNLVGKNNETRNFTFDQVHVEGPRLMARVARECGVKKFIHFSALNASPNPTPVTIKNGSKFLKSKYYGELAVREEFPDATIFRPSDVVGESDDFVQHFAGLQRTGFSRDIAIWDYYDGVVKQPVWISDLVSGIEMAIVDDSLKGKTIQAVGPHRYNFYDLVEYIRSCSGRSQKYDQCRITNLRWNLLMRAAIEFAERTQKYPFLSWERIERDCISDSVDPKMLTLQKLGIHMTPLEDQIRLIGEYMPREGRVLLPYESRIEHQKPERLDLAI